MKLYAIVEGQTEEILFRQVLTPHLSAIGVQATAIVVTTSEDRATGRRSRGGGRRWEVWKKEIQISTRQHGGSDVRFTTMFDLYAFPKGLIRPEDLNAVTSSRRPARIEQLMLEQIADWRFIPYVQRHEMEALVLASLCGLRDVLDPDQRAGVDALVADVGDWAPEDINDGPETAPSKRLAQRVLGYNKKLHGVPAIISVGLETVRSLCPGFDAWLRKLEALAPVASKVAEP